MYNNKTHKLPVLGTLIGLSFKKNNKNGRISYQLLKGFQHSLHGSYQHKYVGDFQNVDHWYSGQHQIESITELHSSDLQAMK